MNVVPRLLQDFSWTTIQSFSANELGELIMLGLMSLGLVAAAAYGVYIAFRPKRGGKQ